MNNTDANRGETLLSVKHLMTQFRTDEGVAHAVEDVSFDVYGGETLGIVGESGSGKSVTALSILRLVTGDIKCGEILFNGTDILKLNDRQLRQMRGKDIAMIFQDPMTSLDPVYTIGFQIEEAILKHNKMGRIKAKELAVAMLRKVGIANPDKRVNDYPHQLSGGMRQRVMIAIGLCCAPKLLIADEPTTALDVTIQAQILDLMRDLKKDSEMSIILITHDLGVVAGMCDRVAVMYCGRIVEMGTVRQVFHDPRHKYTVGLLNSIPRMDKEMDVLNVIEGSVPSIVTLPSGCSFHPRCPHAQACCSSTLPDFSEVDKGHYAACYFANATQEVAEK